MNEFILSCEHGGYNIPQKFQHYFVDHQTLLQTHRGWDIGALKLANFFESQLELPYVKSEYSRLLIEQNRTLANHELFSNISGTFKPEEKEELINQLYLPYLNKLEHKIKTALLDQQKVYHLSIHSFTPVLNGIIREAEIGILFDPTNEQEKEYAHLWKASIEARNKNWNVKFNYPYLGTDDGLTQYFRNKYTQNYAGLELEVNNKLFKSHAISTLGKILLPPLI